MFTLNHETSLDRFSARGFVGFKRFNNLPQILKVSHTCSPRGTKSEGATKFVGVCMGSVAVIQTYFSAMTGLGR
jgi:hypothetical protein